MRLNSNVVLEGADVVLVPYRAEHVALYHEWMSSAWLREMTASEPLTLAQEQEMCTSWRDSDDRLTFIVLERGKPDTAGTGQHGGAMVGDVNLFFHSWLREEDDHAHAVAEVEVMIGEPSARRRGLATEALNLLMAYSAVELATKAFVAKIGFANVASQLLFTQRLDFKEVSRDDGFEEVELSLQVTAALEPEPEPEPESTTPKPSQGAVDTGSGPGKRSAVALCQLLATASRRAYDPV